MTTTIEVYQAPEGAFTAEVAFRGDGWVNATQMAKPFKKLPAHFTHTAAAQRFIAVLEKDLGTIGKAIVVQNGGACPGTWMHPDLALKFAAWLSPEFDLWCTRTIRRLMSGGLSGPEIKALLAVVADLTARVERNEKLARGAAFDAKQVDDYLSKIVELKHELAERDAAPKWEELERRQRAALKTWVQSALVKTDDSGRIRSTALLAEAMKSLAAGGVVLPRPTLARRWLEEVIQEVYGLGKRHDIPFENGHGRGWKYLTWAQAGTARIVNFTAAQVGA